MKGPPMKMIGLIEFGKTPSDEKWDQIVKAHEELQPTKSILVTNPFTRQPSEITSAKRLANVLTDGEIVGALRWTIDDSSIEVFGDTGTMTPLAEQIASEIG